MSTDNSHDDSTRAFMNLTKGMMVSHYRIIDKIGAGGMGEVYVAEDTKLNRKVALKFLPPHLCQDDDCRARFKREAQAAAGLDHPNVAGIYEVSEFSGRPFYSMQIIEGQSLQEVIAGKELPIERILEIATQICGGLQAAHDQGIIHRDIKPSNILIDTHGRVRIVDFGLATIRGSEHLTKTGSTLGTVGYMSPEQVQGKEIDHRSDLFSLGVLLYEMTTGHAPFKEDTEAATLNSVLNNIPEPLSRYKSGVSDSLQRIISKLLDKDPSLRYQSAADVVSDLKRLSPGIGSVPEEPRKDWWNRYIVPATVIILIAIIGFWYFQSQPEDDSTGIKSLVVLPFENLGAEEDEYFADGITDEITARLAGFSGLRVISRTSAVHYKDSGKPLKEIARELKVDYVLEGTIRWDKSSDTDRVRIIPQLIRASDDSHIWANTFERALTQVFAVQADIATRIADALDVTLRDSEKEFLAAKPTENLKAYDYYLRGKEYWNQGKDSEQAIKMLEKAIELDSNFYPAYAWLPRVYGFEYINDIHMTVKRKMLAKNAAEKAYRLAEGKPEGYLALGYYHYYFSRDYDRALEFLQQALNGQPNNSDLIAAMAYVQRRQGNWDAAVAGLQRVVSLNPYSLGDIDGLLRTLLTLHRIEEAEEVVNQALELVPDNVRLLFWEVAVLFYSGGDDSQLISVLQEYDSKVSTSESAFLLVMGDIYLRDYQSALERQTVPTRPTSGDSVDFYIQKGQIYCFMNDSVKSRVYFDSARIICEERIRTEPDVALFRANLAIACAGVGQKNRAIQEGELAAELLPVSKDEVIGPNILQSLSVVYTMVGEYDLAIDQLDYLLNHPSSVQIESVKHYPIYDPLRDHLRFQALIEKYEKEHGI